jgi:hypothetical protein
VGSILVDILYYQPNLIEITTAIGTNTSYQIFLHDKRGEDKQCNRASSLRRRIRNVFVSRKRLRLVIKLRAPLMVQLGLAPRNNTITSTTLHHQRLAGILTDASHQAAPLPMPAPNIVPQAPLGAVTPRCLSRYRPASLPEGWHFLSFKQVGHITMVQ